MENTNVYGGDLTSLRASFNAHFTQSRNNTTKGSLMLIYFKEACVVGSCRYVFLIKLAYYINEIKTLKTITEKKIYREGFSVHP